MSMIKDLMPGQEEMRTAHIDEAHVGDIKGAWGTIRLGDIANNKEVRLEKGSHATAG